MKTILITGSTDGLGLATAKMLSRAGHRIILHGRSESKLLAASQQLPHEPAGAYCADFSQLNAVRHLAQTIKKSGHRLDVLINNAGVFHVAQPLTPEGLDIRFVVNCIAPYLLCKELLADFKPQGRVVNLSSAAQARVQLDALLGKVRLSASSAYAQSKLGITMWTNALAARIDSPLLVSVNPRSFLATPMVREVYGMAGVDVNIGADILCRAALSPEFAQAHGKYYDNDQGRFTSPHPDALQASLCERLLALMDEIISHNTEANSYD